MKTTYFHRLNLHFRAALVALPLLIGSLSCVPAASGEQPVSVVPAPRLISYNWMSLARWYRMHADDVEIAEAGVGKVLFIGDSITEGWSGAGREAWEQYFEPMGAINFGIGGDMTQNLLWRLDHGAVGNLSPEKIVLLIGINNFGLDRESPDAVALGVKAVVAKLHRTFPEAEMLVFAIFPSGEFADNPVRAKIRSVYEKTRLIEEIPGVTYLDIGDQFLQEDGRIPKEIMPDFLHPSLAGYKIMAETIMKWLAEVDS